ncbi:MAG: peptidylprolyl isomerase, partial [Bacteroidota bacterium]
MGSTLYDSRFLTFESTAQRASSTHKSFIVNRTPLLLTALLVAAVWPVYAQAAEPASVGIAPPTDVVTPTDTVAVVAGKAVLAERFRKDYVEYILTTGTADDPRRRIAFLESTVAGRLMGQDALDAGLAETAAYEHRAETVRRKLLVEAWLYRTVYDTIRVTNVELEHLHTRAATRMTARHLYARSKAEADQLYARLQAGETFETLAREVFADTALANSGGHVGTFGFEDYDPAFEETAFALNPGEISEPVRTAQGYSVIQLLDRFTQPMVSEMEFAAARDRVTRYAEIRRRETGRQAVLARTLADLAPEMNEPAFQQLADDVLGRTVRLQESAPSPQTLLVSFGPADARQTWTLEQFA